MTEPTKRKHTLELNRVNRQRFARTVRGFLTSRVGGKAKGLLALLVGLLFAISGLNVLNSYVGRDFMTAIEDRNTDVFVSKMILYIGVFALSTVVATIYRFAEERLGLLWREWLTRGMLQQYLSHRMYYHLNETGRFANPDQRIAEDARSFAVTTLSLLLLLLNGTITVTAFSGVLWSISPLLFGVAVGYAVVGSLFTVVLGRRLIRLNYAQADKEAFFRTDLVHLRENAEWVAFLHREGRMRARLTRHLDALVENFRRIIAVNRNLSFFTTGYNYLIQIIPIVIVAPLFIRGEVEFGVITQSSMAFAHLMGAFSVIVTQFQSLSSYAAVLARLGDFDEAAEEIAASDVNLIELQEEKDRVAFDRLTLWSPRDGRVLIQELSLSIPAGTNVLIRGDSDTVKIALVRAMAGMWARGAGRIIRPGPEGFLVMPERPYVAPGTLRELVVRAGYEHTVSEAQVLAVLRELQLERVVTRAGGLDVERDWNNILSLDEQQLLVLARLLLAAPRFALLDRIGTALSPPQVEQVLDTLSRNAITCIFVNHGENRLDRYNAVLDLHEGGSWKWTPLKDGNPVEEGIIQRSRMHWARCLCGDVTWELDGPFEWMSHCHCSRCRKAHGAAFATYVAAPAVGFRLRGVEHVRRWESAPGFLRCFCGHCGSVVPGDPSRGRVFAPAGNFEEDPGIRPMAHIFVASKAPWFEIRDDLPRLDAYPPGVDAPVLPDRPPLDPPGSPRGSCLCGGVTYVVEGALVGCWNCHCSRCRRGRSAAFASNLFTSSDGLRFTRGEGLLVSYKLPETQRFTQAFCRTCGSIMPRIDRDRALAIVPMGSLDDDPGMRPQAHIFVGSMAPWYTIADDLPQHAEYPQTT